MKRPVTDDERKAIYIFANKGLPYRDIARLMGRSIGTINSVISKGILTGAVDRRIERDDKRKD